jgi:Galactose oxidase, central domain
MPHLCDHIPSASGLVLALATAIASTNTATAQWHVGYQRARAPGVAWVPGGGYFDRQTNRIVVSSENGVAEWHGRGGVLLPGDPEIAGPYPGTGPGTTGNPAICPIAYPSPDSLPVAFAWSPELGTLIRSGNWFVARPPGFPVPSSVGVMRKAMIHDPGANEAILVFEQATPPAVTAWKMGPFQTWQSMPLPVASDYFGGFVFDPQQGALLLTDVGAFAWSGSAWNAATAPATFATGRALAYDSGRQKIVAFGGRVGGAVIAATLEWDGLQWTTVSTLTSPPARDGATLVYDEARQQCVLFGGHNSTFNTLQDIWVFDGSDWSVQTESTVRPPARSQAMLADDGVNGPLLFGGRSAAGAALGDTWQFDGQSWTQLAGAAPPPRFGGVMVSPAPGEVFLFGGTAANGTLLSDYWTFSAGAWTQRPSPTSGTTISQASNAAAAADNGGLVWLRGGLTSNGASATLFAYQYSLANPYWLGSYPAPTFREGHAMAFDSDRNRLVVYGGRDSQGALVPGTEEFDIANTTWNYVNQPVAPELRVEATMVYDPIKRRTILDGGFDPITSNRFAARWEWDGDSWQPSFGGLPSPTSNAAATFHAAAGRTVMFGGTTNTAAAIDRTLDIEQHVGAAVLGLTNISAIVERMPTVGAVPLPLEFAVDAPAGIAASFFDFGLVPRPFPVGLPPLFCSPTPYHIGTTALPSALAIGNPARFFVPFPTLPGPVTLVMQGVSLAAGCVEVTEPLFLHVRP